MYLLIMIISNSECKESYNGKNQSITPFFSLKVNISEAYNNILLQIHYWFVVKYSLNLNLINLNLILTLIR